MPSPADWDPRGCFRLGPLSAFVEQLDEGADSRSLHQLMGQLHMAAGDPQAKLQWVAAMRARFAATQAACFECELSPSAEDAVVADPPGRHAWTPLLEAIKASVREAGVGEGVLHEAALPSTPMQKGSRVAAAAVKCAPSRAVGFAVVRPHDAAGNPKALLQYLAATAWHLGCVEAAANKFRGSARSLSPLDLVDLLPLPCVVTDAAGRALERNDAFGEFMDTAGVRVSTGRLRFDDPFLQDSWRLALAEVHVTALRQSLLVAAPDGRHWRMHLVPLRCALDADDPTERQMIVAIVEQQPPAGEGGALSSLMIEAVRPLTPAEHEVLDAVLQGHSAKVIASARGASVNTVRSQITAILEKTGHHNQKSLMAAFAPSGFRHSTSSIGTPIPTRGPARR